MIDLGRRGLPIVLGLSVVLFAAHIYIAAVQPFYAYIDDLTYLAASVAILDHTMCPLVAGNSCNYEHPPLAKLLMALGFLITGRASTFGANAGTTANQFGGRLFQMVMESISAPVLYLIVRKISGNAVMAFIAALFILVDPLYFTLGSTAILDTPMVFLGILALLPLAYAPTIKVKGLGGLDAYLVTGAVLGLSLLAKETALFIILAVLSYVLLVGDGTWRTRLVSCVKICVGVAIAFCVFLEVYDLVFTGFPSFVSQILLMESFHEGAGPGQIAYLTSAGNCLQYVGLCPTNRSLLPHFLYSGLPLNWILSSSCLECWAATNPLDWLTYFPPVVMSQSLVTVVNYPLVWLAYAWVPLVVWRFRSLKVHPEGKVALLGLSIFSWNVISDIYIYSVLGRPTFEWYFLPAVPALAMGGAYLVTRPGIPRWARYALILAVLATALLLSDVLYQVLYPNQPCPLC